MATSTALPLLSTCDGDGAWALAGRTKTAITRQHLYADRPGRREPQTLYEKKPIKTPTLLIGGGDTQGALSRNWRALATHIPDAKIAIIPGTRHWFEQAPEEFSKIVLEYLAD
jgi:pimeloyl-ACP methyl ester carboxylesterase